jgi:putative zinc finger/helix-turn-helix YgiT family protein
MYNLQKGQLCPACQSGKLDEIRKDLIFKYKNRTKKLQNEKVFKCNICDYEGLSSEANRRLEKELTDFRRKIDGMLSGDQLKKIRESLGLNKKRMAKILSVNSKTVGRYENGKITQSQQIDKLYRFLHRFPSEGLIILKGTSGLLYDKISPGDNLEQGIYAHPKGSFVSSSHGTLSIKKEIGASTNTTYFSKIPENYALQAA